jgi:hypothetical protein
MHVIKSHQIHLVRQSLLEEEAIFYLALGVVGDERPANPSLRS